MNRLQQSRRGKIGYVYNQQVNNNVSTVNYGRTPYYVQLDLFKQKMEGKGFTDTIRSVYDKGKNVANIASKISDIYSSESATNLRNLLPNSDITARSGFQGEKHAILKLPNGKYGVANYAGPGTNLVERLKRGDPPRTEVDKISQAHDIRYFQAKNVEDVRKADNIMLNKVAQIQRNRGDAPQNIAQAKLIRAKTIGEDLGILKRDAFSGNFEENKKIQNREMIDTKLKTLEQEGYGLGGLGMLPGDALKLKILKEMSRKRNKLISGAGKKMTGISSNKTFPDMKGYKLMGSGIILPGGGKDNISNFVVNKVIPSLMSVLNIPSSILPIPQLTSIISKSLDMVKNNNLPGIISQLSKTILPIVTHAKVKTMGGSGRLMKGKGITEILGNAKNYLLSNLGKGLFGAFKLYLNNSAKQQGYKTPFNGSGLSLAGGSLASFFEDFKKGFTSVFKPLANVIAPIISAVGLPQIGIPLGIASKIL